MFDVAKVEKKEDSYHFYLSEKNIHPKEYTGQHLESKGFFDEATLHNFSLRGKPSFLHLKRCKWLNHDTRPNGLSSVASCSSRHPATIEFAAFLKGFNR
ncbi:hypothetical protein BDE36_0817 [Arcticibacter tournemirensis]|nr:hypothetical protein BDE36_0817 [Arcticibacter tournemirensis]